MNTAHNTRTNKHARSHTLRTGINALSLSIALAFSLAPVSSWAQEPPVNISIAAQPLGEALLQLGQQTSLQIFFSPDVAAGLTARPLSGNLEPEQALRQLLEGTGIRYVRDGNNITLSRPAEVGTVMLPPVAVSGKALGAFTEGTGSYTTQSSSTAARFNLSLKETPQSVTVITRQRMDDQKIENMVGVINATPGAYVNDNSVAAGPPATWVRGTNIDTYMFDGMPTLSANTSYLQSTAIYDRVEIVRGANGLMSSVGNPAATVNLIRKRPTYQPQVQLNAQAGNWERYGLGMDVSGPLNSSGNIRGRLVADYKTQGDWTKHFEEERATLYGIAEMDLGDSSLLTLGISHMTRDADAPPGQVALNYGDRAGAKINSKPKDMGRPSWAYLDNEITNAFLNLEHQLSDRWVAKAELSHTDYSQDGLYHMSSYIPDPGTSLSVFGATVNKVDREENSLDAYMSGLFSLFGKDHELTYGVSISKMRTHVPNQSAAYSSGTQYIPRYQDVKDMLQKPDLFAKNGYYNEREYQYAAYINSRFDLGYNTFALLGARVTNWKKNRDTSTYSTGAVTKNRLKETGYTTPYFGITHNLNDALTVYASYTSIFSPQTQVTARGENGTMLEPKEGTTYEAGIKQSFNDDRLHATLSLYRSEMDNQPVWLYWEGGTGIYKTEDGTESEGVELELVGELTEGWNFSGGYSYNHLTDKEGDRLATSIPQHILKSFTSYRLPDTLNKLTLGGGLTWHSRTRNSNNSFSQGSYFLANFMSSYEINNNLSIQVNIENLFDKRYLSGYGSWDGTHGAPRNLMVSMKYTY